jgi:superfamily II DNA or RNA helicase
MTALPYMMRASRVLVIVPTDIVRRQVAREFRTLKTLRSAGAFPVGESSPKVRALKTRMTKTDDWLALAQYDVVVATPNCISTHYKDVALPPLGFFDLIIIDEAHHEPAKTWRRIVDDLSTVPVAMLTATPFRRDKKGISGEIAFWYPLRDAIRDRVYSPIDFVPVKRVDGEEFDLTLAKTAQKRLNTKRHVGFGSQLLVRTDRIEDALRLQHLYSGIGLELPVLHSKLSLKAIDTIVESLESGTTRGAIVVGILTEGFDLPQLKIAAYHVRHKSFAATLQFVGRFARTRKGEPLQPELLAAPDDLSDETKELYREDSSWPELLPDIADAAVEREKTQRNYVREFQGVPTGFSLTNVQPRRRAQVFKMPPDTVVDLTKRPERLVFAPVIEFFYDSDEELAALVSEELVHPDWLQSAIFDTQAFNLSVICVDREHGYVYISSHSDAAVAGILEQFVSAKCDRVAAQSLNRALYTYGLEKYSSVGLRSSRFAAAAGVSYRVFAGRSAGDGVRPADMTSSTAGHLIGRFRADGELQSVGVSLDGAKIWESEAATLLDFKEWCFELSRRLESTAGGATPPNIDVPVRQPFTQYPRDAIACDLPIELLTADLRVELSGHSVALLDLQTRVRSAGDRLLVGLAHERRLIAVYQFGIDGQLIARRDVVAKVNGENVLLSDALRSCQIQTFFADGSSVVGSGLIRYPSRLPALRSDAMEAWDWDGVDVSHESLPPRTGFRINVLQKAVQEFGKRLPTAYIVVDDGSNEMSDVVVVQALGPRDAAVDLVHCKWSSEIKPGHRLDDLYQLVCQVSRGLRWANAPAIFGEILRRLDKRQKTKCVHGDVAAFRRQLEGYIAAPPRTRFRAFAVQPGLRTVDLNAWQKGSDLLVSCDQWCAELQVQLIICGSP